MEIESRVVPVSREINWRIYGILRDCAGRSDRECINGETSLVPHVPRYFANKSSARYKREHSKNIYTKRHAKRGGTATPWSNLEVSSAGRRSFVSRQRLREFSPLPRLLPVFLDSCLFLSFSLSRSLSPFLAAASTYCPGS